MAERFEVYFKGIELANGFRELTDAREQRQRFEQDNRRRAARGLPQQPIDTNLLAALEHGMPACSGVALGVDRLIMLALKAESLSEVIAFRSIAANAMRSPLQAIAALCLRRPVALCRRRALSFYLPKVRLT